MKNSTVLFQNVKYKKKKKVIEKSGLSKINGNESNYSNWLGKRKNTRVFLIINCRSEAFICKDFPIPTYKFVEVKIGKNSDNENDILFDGLIAAFATLRAIP